MGMPEIGAKFGLQGLDEAIQKLQRVGQEFAKFSGGVDGQVSKVEGGNQRMAASFDKLSGRIQRSMSAAKLAIGALVTGKAIQGVANWAKGDEVTDKWQDHMRKMGVVQKDMAQYQNHFRDLQKKDPWLTRGDYFKTLGSDVISMSDVKSTDTNKRMVDAMRMTARGLGPEAQLFEASDIQRKYMEVYGAGKSPEERAKMMEKFAAMIAVMVKESRVRGHDLSTSLPYAAAAFKSARINPEEMLATLSLTGGALGAQAGEGSRGYLTKRVEAAAKLRREYAKYNTLYSAGYTSELQVPEKVMQDTEKKLKRREKGYHEYYATLEQQDPTRLLAETANLEKGLRYLKQRGMGIDMAKIKNEAFSEAGSRVYDILANNQKELAGLTGKAHAADFEEAKKAQEASYQSLNAKAQQFENSIKRVSSALRRASSGAISDMLPDAQSIFDKIGDTSDENLQRLSNHIRGFMGGFKGAFSEAFAGFPDITGKVKELMDALNTGDTEKWSKLGQDLGKLVGTNFSDFSETIKGAVGDFHSIAESMKTISGAIEAVGDFFGKSASGMDASKHDENKARSFWQKFAPDIPYIPMNLGGPWDPFDLKSGAETPSPMTVTRSNGQSDFPNWVGPTAPSRRAYAGESSGTAAAGHGGEDVGAIQVNPQLNVHINAEIGDDLVARITSQVIERIGNEQDRRRGNATSRGFQWGRP